MKGEDFVKKLIAVLLGLAMLLMACGLAEADISTLEGWGAAVKAQSEGKTITVAMASHPSTDAFQTMSDEFTQLTGINVEWDIVEETNLKSKQLMDTSGAYDVFMVDAFWMSEYASKDVLIPIGEYAENPEKTPEWFDYEDIMAAYRNGIAGAKRRKLRHPHRGRDALYRLSNRPVRKV